tara:strand:- start:421 stop:1851 length:1431 start_codon:yes stop_codon:yes gene_type:complete
MGGKNHNPSIARRILRDLKRGESPENLIPEIKQISDPYYKALALVYISSVGFLDRKKSANLLKQAFSNVENVEQSWRRLELLGDISKRLKELQDSKLKANQYKEILKLLKSEKKRSASEFFVKNAKHFPASLLDSLLTTSLKLKGHEFKSSKAVVRHWLNHKSAEDLIKVLSIQKGEIRPKLLGYLHFQLNKSKIKTESSALELALKASKSEEMLRYLVRICSKPADLVLVESYISTEPSEKAIPISIALIARADRKGWNQLAHQFADNTRNLIESISDSELRDKFKSKLQITTDRLKGEIIPSTPSPKKEMVVISDSGKNTLGIYNTYGGNWNHPHYKAVFKAANLCSAFDLNLALIDFPEIEPDYLVSEIKKEMRLANDGYLSQLFSKDRIRFFERDIDESWTGSKIVTTANPESSKKQLPEGKICMVMGLGPKGLPKSYIAKSKNHFEITGSGVAFETGTAMGAIAGHLHLMQ